MAKRSRRSRKDIRAIIRDGTAIDRAFEAARRRVVREHLRLGIPLAIWQDGRVVVISPETAVALQEKEDAARRDRA